MPAFRSHDGQRSDNVPIKRTAQEKKLLLKKLKEELAGLKPWTAPALRSSLENRIAELQKEIGRG